MKMCVPGAVHQQCNAYYARVRVRANVFFSGPTHICTFTIHMLIMVAGVACDKSRIKQILVYNLRNTC